MAAAPHAGTDEQVVAFLLGNESYCVDISRVHEIIQMREITAVPGFEHHVRGLINLRGTTIPVVDLRRRLELLEVEPTAKTRIIVVEAQTGCVGIIVDSVREVMTLSSEQIDKTPNPGNDCGSDFVRGVAKCGDQLITLLNLDLTLAGAETN